MTDPIRSKHDQLTEWATDKIDSTKTFLTPKVQAPHQENNSFFNRVKDFFYWAKIDSQPDDPKATNKVLKGTALITIAQVFSLPALVIGYVVGGPLGALRGLFKSKNEHKPRFEEIKDRSSESIQITTRLASILPSSWIAMGLAHLGERHITQVTPFVSESSSTLEKSFSMANLILRRGQVPLKLKTNDTPTLSPLKTDLKERINLESRENVLLRLIDNLKFDPPSSVGESANELIQTFLNNAKAEFTTSIDTSENQELLTKIQDLTIMLREAEQGNIIPLRNKILDTNTSLPFGVQADFELTKNPVPDLKNDLAPKSTPITRSWLKATFAGKEGTPRYDLYKNAPKKDFSLITAGADKYQSNQVFTHTPPHLNVMQDGGIPYQKFVRWGNEPIDNNLECFPVLAQTIASNIQPYRDQDAPTASVVRNISPNYTFDKIVYTPTNNAPSQNIMVIEVPHITPKEGLSLQDFSKLLWQIASAEFNAFDAAIQNEYESADRHILQPLGIEKTPEQHLLRAAFFLTEASLRQAAITIPEDAPEEYLIALDIVQQHIIPEIESGSDRERIVDVLSDIALQFKDMPK